MVREGVRGMVLVVNVGIGTVGGVKILDTEGKES